VAALVNFRHLWTFAATMAVLSGLVTTLLKRGRPLVSAAAADA
jgi:hypothetical protein